MSQAVADRARVECDAVVVVNKAVELAPWADALAANDHAWWRANPWAKQFAGRKFSANKLEGVEQVESGLVTRQSSSGVLGLWVAGILGATEVELHGFENRGDHYFGLYPSPLRNTSPSRYREFENQIAALGRKMKKDGIRIVNRTPDTALRCFERG
jgi:hypothetical protein